MDMQEQLENQLKADKVKNMLNPNILMNESDFDGLRELLESISNVKTGEFPTYEGMPISSNDNIQKGTIIIYDKII